jgi:hypothetical protein
MFSGLMNGVLGTSYTSEDADLIATENNYAAKETELQRRIDNIERDYPGYDEYRYDLDNIGHNPHELASYLTALLQSGRTIVNAFTFGPAIVKDGVALPIPETYLTRFDSNVRAPRTVLAQIGPLEYVFVEAEGRVQHSKGVTTDQMGEFMVSLGVQTAYCMDGGNSSIMLFNGKYFDANYAASEREQSDIIYIATAVPDYGR